MKSLYARGVALALASCALVSTANAQQAPYGAANGQGFYQPIQQPTLMPASGSSPANGHVAPYEPAYTAPYGPNINEPAYGNGLQGNSPNWTTAGQLPSEPAGADFRLQPSPIQQGYGKQQQFDNSASPYAEPQWQSSPWSNQTGDEICYATSGCGCGSCWFGGVYGLIMTRNKANDVWLSYDTNDIQNRVLTSRDAAMGWGGGFETRFGRYFNSGNNALEAVYWGVYPSVSQASAYPSDVSGGLNTILHLDQVTYDNGTGPTNVSDAFFLAQRHQLTRSYQFHNIELNLLGGCSQACYGGPRFSWLTGVRYFRFDEGFRYATDPTDPYLSGDQDEVEYMINVVNNLVGCQIGGRIDYCLWNGLDVYAGSKVGVYGNHIKHRSQVNSPYADAYVNDPGGPFDSSIVCVSSTKNDVSMIGELNLGANYQMTRCWSINAGYRAVAISGLALSTNQIPHDYISDLDSLRNVDSNGSMILHGFYGGVQYNW